MHESRIERGAPI